MSFRNPLTGPVTIGGTVSVQTPSTPGLVLGQPQALNLVGSSGVVAFSSVIAGATIATVTLTPPAGKTAYFVAFDWSVRTAGILLASPKIVLTGPATALTYQLPNYAGSATAAGSQTAPQPIPASAPDVPLVLTWSYASASSASAGYSGVLNASAFSL